MLIIFFLPPSHPFKKKLFLFLCTLFSPLFSFTYYVPTTYDRTQYLLGWGTTGEVRSLPVLIIFFFPHLIPFLKSFIYSFAPFFPLTYFLLHTTYVPTTYGRTLLARREQYFIFSSSFGFSLLSTHPGFYFSRLACSSAVAPGC